MRTTVLSYLEESAVKYANKVAFFDEEKSITFSGLRKRAIDVGYFIKERVAGKRNPVLIYLPKTVESIVAFMGVLYSGNFYTPTDIRFPAEKVLSVIETLHPEAVIVDSRTSKKFLKFAGDKEIQIINLDEVNETGRYGDSTALIDEILDVDPVYTFFTSG